MATKVLILAEKESVAKKIASAIGKAKKEKDHYHAEGNGFIADVYYLFGHILETDVNETLKAAGYPKTFPVYPSFFKLKVRSGRGKLFKAIKEALERAKKGDYDFVINAGDPDREGEILVREVLDYLKVPKEKVKRMWWNSETKKELLRALKEAKPLVEYDHLAVAGEMRKVADFWLGINGSIALQKRTGNKNLSIGRVQTPVLKLIVERDLEIENFKPEKYYVIKAFCEKEGKEFVSLYQHGEKLFKDERKAKEVLNALKKTPYLTVVKVEKKLKKQPPPSLPKLSDVQQEAGKYGFTAKETLSVVQKLYESEIVTYPRTDSRFLSQKDETVVVESLKALGKEEFIPLLKDAKVRKRMFNDKDVERAGHHAIIPLKPLPKGSSKAEKAIYGIILKRFLAQFYPEYEYEQTAVLLRVPETEYLFKATGKVDKKLGWKELYKAAKGGEEEKQEGKLPELAEGEKVRKTKEALEEKWTEPPKRYTSARLIKVMEKLGLGTQATRHSYEEILIKRGYVRRGKGGVLRSTEAGRKLIEGLRGLGLK